MPPLTLEELAARYQRASDAQARNDAAEAALRACADLIRLRAARYTGSGVDRDELEQIARMGLLDALRTYRAGKGTSFTTFAARVMGCDLSNAVRDYGRQRRGETSLDALMAAEDGEGDANRFEPVAPPPAPTEEQAECVGRMSRLTLTPGMVDVLRLAWDGLTAAEQAAALGTTKRGVESRWQEMLARCKAVGLPRAREWLYRWALRERIIEP